MTQEFLEKIIEAHNVCCPICGQKATLEMDTNGSYKTVVCHEALNKLVEQNEEALFSCADPTYRPFASSEKSKVEVSITYGQKE